MNILGRWYAFIPAIAIRGSHLIKFIIPGGQRLRQHQPALVRNIEGIQCFRVRIVDGLGDKFPGGKILDLKTGSGHRDNLSGLCVTFFNFQTGCDGAVVQDIAVSLSVRGNEYRKVRDKGFANVTIGGCFKIDGFRICSSEKGLYVNMPATQDKGGNWKDVCWPVTAEFRKQLNDALIDGYGQAIENLQATLEATKGAAEKPSLTGALKENAGKVKEQPTKPAPSKNEQAR